MAMKTITTRPRGRATFTLVHGDAHGYVWFAGSFRWSESPSFRSAKAAIAWFDSYAW